MEAVNTKKNLYAMKMEYLGEVHKIEKCTNNIANFVDMWRNLSAQLEATKKAIFKLNYEHPILSRLLCH